MKKKIALLLVLVLLLSFTGCTLEGMRETHLKFDENGNIPFNGQLYIPLADDRGLLNITIDYGKTYYTTEADVPLLLQDTFGFATCVSEDGKFLRVWGDDFLCYCRSDIYEEVKHMLQNPDALEYFCIDPQYSGPDMKILLTKEESLWLKGILENTELVDKFDTNYSEYFGAVYACSEDMLLQQKLFGISRNSGGYFFEKYNEKTESYDAIILTPKDSIKMADILARGTVYYGGYEK